MTGEKRMAITIEIDVVGHLGAEIIRRWLGGVEPELWHHQPRDHYWKELCRFAKYEPGKPEFHDGVWVARTDDAEPPDGGRPLG